MISMMSPHAGIYLGDQQLMVAVASRRGGVQCFAVEMGDAPGTRLKTELDTRQLRLSRARFGLSRTLATVKALDLPPAEGAQLTGMVAFELERHVPFPPEDMRFDFAPLPGTPTSPSRVLVTACERRTVEGALRLLEESRLKPAALTVACHDLPTLLSRGGRAGLVVWAHRTGDTVDLVCLATGRLHLSRAVPAAGEEALAGDVDATLSLLGWADCDAIWVSGDEAEPLMASPALASLAGSVSAPPWTAAVAALLQDLSPPEIGRATLALATALGSRRPPLNLLPVDLRPRTFSTGQLVTAGTVSLAVLLGLGVVLAQGYKQHRYAAKLSDAIHQLDSEVKAVERLSADLAQKKRLLEAVRSLEKGDLRALPVMRELAEKLPQDAWLRTFSMDKQGLEITGQASAANQLIPLLENSPSHTRVEFTAPVTKAGDKEQFRIKAGWKNSAPPEAPPVAGAKPIPLPPAPPPARPPANRPGPVPGR